MQKFIANHQHQIAGVLSGFDRLVFRGTLLSIVHTQGMSQYLASHDVLLKNFGSHVERVSSKLKTASVAEALATDRPVRYLASSALSKEQIAQHLATKDAITAGLVCVLTCVEPCRTFEIYRDRATGNLRLQPRIRKCLFVYHYRIHPVFGFLSARIQTWFPFSIQICLNGREWLAQQMNAQGLGYLRHDNCFPWIEDWAQAQQLMDQQLTVDWPSLLADIAGSLNPIHEQLFAAHPATYYWSTYQSEWAIDISFRHAADLRRLFPRLLQHAITSLSSGDIMRFLGRRVPLSGEVPKDFKGEVVSDLRERQEGVRIKHRLNANSVKAYDKAFTDLGSVLRLEATINRVADFRVYRPKQGEHTEPAWRPLRRGIADLPRHAEVARKAAERYLEALATVDDDATLSDLLGQLDQPKYWHGRRVRALRPFAPDDRQLLQLISRGEFTLNGLRNRDLQRLCFTQAPTTPDEARRRSAWVGRKLRLLRAHRLIYKISHTHRYQLTKAGRATTTLILTALRSTARQLTTAAA
ncbi:MAG: hypothetical protein JO352_29655 [Chloroflexi bacterium]|nr:hypothetical protein [Chloroflexota bacterium]